MRVTVINPNSTASMTETIAAAARQAAFPSTSINAVTSAHAPASIEGHFDEAMCVIGIADAIRSDPAADAYVIACFGDPGLLAAREVTSAPVIGIAEAAMRLACFVSTGFSVVTTLERTRVIAEALVLNYGLERHCRRVRATDIPVLELERLESHAFARILAECRAAVAEDKSGAIVLGCAGMADLGRALEDELGVPVIDGVAAAVKTAEALVGMGWKTSKAGDLATPLPKQFSGMLRDWSIRS